MKEYKLIKGADGEFEKELKAFALKGWELHSFKIVSSARYDDCFFGVIVREVKDAAHAE